MRAARDLARTLRRAFGTRSGISSWGLPGCVVAGVLIVGCTVELSETVHGSGASTTEFREVDVFEAIEVHGGLDVYVVVGEQEHVILNGDDNLIEYVESDVEDGRLQLRVRRGYRLDPVPRIEVGARELRAVALLGGGDVDVRGIEGAAFALDLTGSGDLTCAGSIESLDIDITGSGNMDLRHLIAAEVAAGMTGSGDLEAHATRALTARITGSGDLIYRGRPHVIESVTGSGEVRRKRD